MRPLCVSIVSGAGSIPSPVLSESQNLLGAPQGPEAPRGAAA